jgi:hypothetical protein
MSYIVVFYELVYDVLSFSFRSALCICLHLYMLFRSFFSP